MTTGDFSASEPIVDPPSRVLPFGDPSRGRRIAKLGAWLLSIVVALIVLGLLGIDVRGWLSDLREQIKQVPARYIVAGLFFQSA